MKIKIIRGKKAWHWRLVGENNEIRAHSEDYSSKAKCFEEASKVADDIVMATHCPVFYLGKRVLEKRYNDLKFIGDKVILSSRRIQ